MSDSEDDRLPDQPKAPRQKRFRFKTFAERVSEVEVDVYRSLAPVKAEPSSGSWLADGLAHWRELNSAAHFLQTAAALQPLCQSLPLLLHHRETIASIILSSLEPAARLSLPALLDLLSSLARDLQQEFLPLLPRTVRRIVALLDGGAEREPESLEAIFTCVSHICKYLIRHLAADIPFALRHTAPLRYHSADYVRQFAAQAFGFLLRSAPNTAAAVRAVRAVLAEQAVRPTEERTDGAGLLLAEAVLGVSHGLHSRAPVVLQLMLKEDLLTPEDFRPAAVAPSRGGGKSSGGSNSATGKKGGQSGAAAAAGTARNDAVLAVGDCGRKGKGSLPYISQEQMRARAAAVARVALARLLDHLRRGKGGELWTALLAEVGSRLRAFEAAAGAGQELAAPAAAASRSLGRSVLLVAQAVEYFRGSRVESYQPLMELLSRLMQPGVWLPTSLAATAANTADGSSISSDDGVSSEGMSPVPSPRSGAKVVVAQQAVGNDEVNGEEAEAAEELLDVSLSYAVLELARGVVYGHIKAVGASEGLEALARVAASWAPCFSRPPAGEALAFVKALMVPPAGADIARVFAPQMMGCLGRLLMPASPSPAAAVVVNAPVSDGGGTAAGAGGSQHGQVVGKKDFPGCALLLLRDLCALLQPLPSSGGCSRTSGLPLLLTAQPHGVRLAAHVRRLATEWRADGTTESGDVTDPRVSAEAWAAVSLLSYACENAVQAITACESVLDTSTAALSQLRQLALPAPQSQLEPMHQQPRPMSVATGENVTRGLLLLRATATELLADLLQQNPAQSPRGPSVSLVAAAESALRWLLEECSHQQQPPSHGDPSASNAENERRTSTGLPYVAADYGSIRAAGALLSTVRTGVNAAAAGGGGGTGSMGAAAFTERGRTLLAESRLRDVLAHLAPLLAHESQPLRAAVLRLLCCFDQPSLLSLGPDANDPTASVTAATRQQRDGGDTGPRVGAGPRCDLLEVLYGINSQPFTIESGRKWTVAMGRLKTYLEYGRIPDLLVPAFAYGMVGVLYIRFSPLWQPASEALATGLQYQTKVFWPIAFAFLSTSQRQLLSADFPSAAAPTAAGTNRHGSRNRHRHSSSAAISAAITAAPVTEDISPSQDPSYIETLDERYGATIAAGTPQAAGGVTDPQNRLSHALRAMAAAPYTVIEQYSRHWVPLFLEYTAARGSHFDDGEGDVEATVAAARAAAANATNTNAAGAGIGAGDVSLTATEQQPRKKARLAAARQEKTANGVDDVTASADDVTGLDERRASHAAASSSAAAAAAGTAAAATTATGSGKKRKAGAAGSSKKAPAAAAGAHTAPPSADITTPTPQLATAAAAAAATLTPSHAGTKGSLAVVSATITDPNESPPDSGGGTPNVSILSRIGGKTWRAGLLDWLKLLAGLRGVKSLYCSEEVQRAVSSHLMEADGGIQAAALKCLRPYRFRWLPGEMAERLGRLADDATLREELAIFPLAPGADGGVGEDARPGLIPLIVRLLFPKMRKRSGRLGGRGASGSARAAILNFLANLRPAELRPLLELLLEPMAAAFASPLAAEAGAARVGGPAAAAVAREMDVFRLLPAPWWSAPMLGRGMGWWLAAVHQAGLDALPARRKVGFLNAFEDLLSHLGHAVEPFLPVLLAITLRLLATATAAITTTTTATEVAEEEAERQATEEAETEDGKGLKKKWRGVPSGENGGGKAGGGRKGKPTVTAPSSDSDLGSSDKDEDVPKTALAMDTGSGGDKISDAAEGEENAPEAPPGSGAGDGGGPNAAVLERHREIRSSALRLLAQVWLRFPAAPSVDFNEAWGVFLPAVQPLVPRLMYEAASSKEPPLLECVLSLSLSPGLARVLGNRHSVPDATLSLVTTTTSSAAAAAAAAARRGSGTQAPEAEGDVASRSADGEGPMDVDTEWDVGGDVAAVEEWQTQGLGSALLRGVVAMLGSGRCTEIVRATVLDVLDAVLGCGEVMVQRVLRPWLGEVLTALHAVIAESWQQGGGGRGAGGRGRGRGGYRRCPAPGSSAHRELAILEQLGGMVSDAALARRLADSLVALMAQAAARTQRVSRSSSGARRAPRLDESGISRALGALAALWGRLEPGDLPQEVVERYCEAMSLWAIRLNGRESRTALAAAYGAVARLLPYMAPVAALLADLTAWSATALDELDYDRRMAAYGKLSTADDWTSMDRLQALPLTLAALHDLRNATDLALRQAAATALAALVTAMAAADNVDAAVDIGGGAASATAADGLPEGSLLRLASRVLYPQLRSQLVCTSLAVRQEHLALLRALGTQLPGRFPDLAALVSEDVETDFFNNVAHLQSHRRTRALAKLTKSLRSQRETNATSLPATTTAITTTSSSEGPSALGRSLTDVIIPLLQQFIEEASGLGGGGGSGRAHEKKQSDVDKEANVTDAAITALGAVAGCLAWPQYEQLLNQFIRMMKLRPAKPLIRAVCAILDNFHFALPSSGEAEAEGGDALMVGADNGTANGTATASVAGEEKKNGKKAGTQQQEQQQQKAGATDAQNQGTAAKEKDVEEEDEEEEEEEDDNDDEQIAAAAVYDAAAEAAAVQRALLGRILPALHEQLVERKRGEDEEAASVRAPVALALVKLLKLLPPAAERAELPRALQGVTNLLRCRFQRVRDDARAVLVSMMAELGPRYLPYACHVLRASLPARGFTAHVLGYTLHAVLEAVMKVAHGESAAAAAAAVAAGEAAAEAAEAPTGYDIDDDENQEGAGAGGGGGEEEPDGGVGVLDESLEMCLPMIEADLFGEISEAKEVTAFAAQYKEAKRCRANEAYQLLASGITFSTHMRQLMSVVTDRLHLAGAPTIRAKLTQLLQFAARGVRVNSTAGPKQIMALFVGIMEGCLTREEAARARAKAAVGPAGSTAASLGPAATTAAAAARAAEADRAALHEFLVLEFCLTLLHSGVKRGALTGRSPELMALLNPALPLLVRSLRSRHAGCVSLALRTLAHIVPLPLPGIAAAAPDAGRALTALLKKVPNVRHPIAQECFRLLAALLRDCAAYQPTTAQLRFLLRWAFEDLGEAGAQPTAFGLLRALLGRRVVVPEVYDVMDRVQAILVRSQAAPVRSSCSVALLQFLLDFPLGPSRLKNHLAFLLANLDYEYESGRLQVLDLLNQIVAKFPSEALQAQSDVLLMPLVVRLVSDSSSKARASAGEVIRALLRRLTVERLDSAVSYCRAWLERGSGAGVEDGEGGEEAGGGEGRDAALRRAAAQTLGLVAEVEGGRFGRRLGDLTPAVLRVLQRQADRGVDGIAATDGDSPDADAACPGWQEAYYCLLLLEKVAAQAGGALAWPTGQSSSKTEIQIQNPRITTGGGAASSLVPVLWEATVRLLLHRHMWVRKAAARLVGYGLASPRVCGGLMESQPGRAGCLAFSFFLQMECEGADEATCLQAVKCLVSLSVHLHREDGGQVGSQEGLPTPQGGAPKRRRTSTTGTTDASGREEDDDDDTEGANGHDAEASDGGEEDEDGNDDGATAAATSEDADGTAAGDDGAEDDDADDADDVSMAAQDKRRAFTLRGLVRRIARLADDTRWNRVVQRAAALRWTAAAASALGGEAIGPHLPILLRPLYRISEAVSASGPAAVAGIGGIGGRNAGSGGRVPEDVRQLSEEVMAHLRGVVGSEVLLAGYNAARQHVRSLRAERKRRTAVRSMVDPSAAAVAKLRHNARKAEGRKRKLEVMKRERGAKQLRQGGRRRGGGGKR